MARVKTCLVNVLVPRSVTKPEMRAGYAGRMEIGYGEVEDPANPRRRVSVAVNYRESSLSYLHSRHKIDDRQLAAGVAFRAAYERAITGGPSAIDYSRIRVDCGAISDPLSPAGMRAKQTLARLCKVLGPEKFQVLCEVAGRGRTIEDMAANDDGRRSSSRSGKLSKLLKEALDDLVRLRYEAGTLPPKGAA